MAQLDIKNCNVYIVDGYDGPGGSPVIGTAGAMIGATTIPVLGFIGAVNVGDTFTIASDVIGGVLVLHTVTAHTETSLNTTSIVFTPGLTVAAVSADVIVVKPHYIKMRVGDGNLTWTEKRPIVYVKDRGKLDTVRLGDQDPVEVKMDTTWIFLSGASGDTVPQPEECLKHDGKASGWVSSSADPCEPYCVDIVVVYTPPCTIVPETYRLSNFRYEDIGHDLKTGQLAMTGKCNVVQVSRIRGATTAPLV